MNLIQKDYKIYENNHFPKLLDNDYNIKILIKNPLITLYETKKEKKSQLMIKYIRNI